MVIFSIKERVFYDLKCVRSKDKVSVNTNVNGSDYSQTIKIVMTYLIKQCNCSSHLIDVPNYSSINGGQVEIISLVTLDCGI